MDKDQAAIERLQAASDMSLSAYGKAMARRERARIGGNKVGAV